MYCALFGKKTNVGPCQQKDVHKE